MRRSSVRFRHPAPKIYKLINTEIENVHTGGVNLTSITRTNEIQFGFNNEIAGYAMKKNIINGVNAYYLLDNEIIIAGVICKEISINGVEYLQTLGGHCCSAIPRTEPRYTNVSYN